MRTMLRLLFVSLCLLPLADRTAAQTGRDLLQQALVRERAEGDLRGAIAIYERIVREFAGDRQLAANALVHLGECHEKLGNAEAEQAYQRVIREYADQADLVAQARTRLAALRPAVAAGRGPTARRLLSGEDTDSNNLFFMVPSPDGRQVAYVDLMLGGLYLRDLATGTDEQLLTGLPDVWNFAPVWSPDGKRLAFSEAAFSPSTTWIKVIDVATREVVAVQGTEMPYTGRGESTGMEPSDWSRDGRYLLARDGPFSQPGAIRLVPVDGGGPTILVDSAAPGAGIPGQAFFSPDGRWIAYASGSKGHEQILTRAVAGGETHQVTDMAGSNTSPMWSPDGRAIAWQRDDGVWLVPMQGGRTSGTPKLAYASVAQRVPAAWTEAGLYLTMITNGTTPYRVAVDPASGTAGGPAEELPYHPTVATAFAWSPDQRRVAFISDGTEIVIYADAGRSVTTYRPPTADERIAQISWSADGREVLFQSNNRNGRTTRIMALDPATLNAREVQPHNAARVPFGVSADGRYALFVEPPVPADSSSGGLLVVGPGQTEGRRLAPMYSADGGSLAKILALSPTGDRVLYSRQAGIGTGTVDPPDAGSLWLASSDGTGSHRRIGTALRILSATWDPSGRFVAYTGMVTDSTSAVRVVEVATGATREVDVPASTSGEVTAVDWSADGRYIGITVPTYRVEYWLLQDLQSGR